MKVTKPVCTCSMMFLKNVCGKWRDRSKGRKRRTPLKWHFRYVSDIQILMWFLFTSQKLVFTSFNFKASNVKQFFFLVLKLLLMIAYVSRSLTHNFPRWSEYLVPNPHSSPTSYKHEWSRPCHLLSLSRVTSLTATHVHMCQFSCTHTQHTHIHVPQAPNILPSS